MTRVTLSVSVVVVPSYCISRTRVWTYPPLSNELRWFWSDMAAISTGRAITWRLLCSKTKPSNPVCVHLIMRSGELSEIIDNWTRMYCSLYLTLISFPELKSLWCLKLYLSIIKWKWFCRSYCVFSATIECLWTQREMIITNKEGERREWNR